MPKPRPPWMVPIEYVERGGWGTSRASDAASAIAGGSARPVRPMAERSSEAEAGATPRSIAPASAGAAGAHGPAAAVAEGAVRSPDPRREVVRRERQAQGIAKAKAQGVYRGRQPGTTKGLPDRARGLQAEGMSAPEIGRALGVSLRTVFRYLAALGPRPPAGG